MPEMRFHKQLYRAFLVVYSLEYRREYGEPMTQLLADRLRTEGGGLRTLGVWAQTLIDLVRSAFAERMETTMKTLKTRWWRILALPISVFVAVAGIGLPFEEQTTAGPNWLQGAVLYALAAVVGLGLVVAGMLARRRNRKTGSILIGVGMMPAFPMTIMFWFPPVAAVGLVAILISMSAFLDASKAPQVPVEIA